MGLDPESPVPLWHQIYEVLLERIREEGGGARLSDSVLSREFGVSRMTVRQAMQRLVDEGLVRRSRGRGTTVVEEPIAGQLSEIERFFDEWRLQGRQFDVELLSRRQVPASRESAEALGVEVGEPIEFLERRRTVNGHGVVFDIRYLPLVVARELSDAQLRSESIWVTLEKQLGIGILCAEMELRAVAAPARIASFLGLRAGRPLLDRQVRILDEDKRGVLAGHSYYDSARFVYRVTANAHRDTPLARRHASREPSSLRHGRKSSRL